MRPEEKKMFDELWELNKNNKKEEWLKMSEEEKRKYIAQAVHSHFYGLHYVGEIK